MYYGPKLLSKAKQALLLTKCGRVRLKLNVLPVNIKKTSKLLLYIFSTDTIVSISPKL